MSNMGRYCKAYPAEALRAFPGWSEKTPPLHLSIEKGAAEGEAATTDTAPDAAGGDEPMELDYYYIQEDYTVTAGIFLNEDVAFDNVTEEWKAFCTDELKFEIPNYELEPAVATATSETPAPVEAAVTEGAPATAVAAAASSKSTAVAAAASSK